MGQSDFMNGLKGFQVLGLGVLTIAIQSIFPAKAIDSAISVEQSEALPNETAQFSDAEGPPLVSLAPILPLLTPAELDTLLMGMNADTEVWFGWAGMAKMTPPAPFPEDLLTYRQSANVSPGVAPFLGFWQGEGDFPYSVSIFPSAVPEQVCVVAFKPEWSLLLVDEVTGEVTGKDVITEGILSFAIATVEADQLRSNRIRTAAEAISMYAYRDYNVQIMGIMDDQDIVRPLAATAAPQLPPQLSTEAEGQILQALAENQCSDSAEPSQT